MQVLCVEGRMQMAKKRDSGKKYPIIFVRHSMTRVFRNLLFSTLVLLLVWWVAPYAPGFFRPPNDIYLIWIALLFMVGMIMTLFFRNGGFAQARKKFLLIKLPLFRVKVPYDAIENVRMVLFKDLYEKKKMSWSQRRFLTHYFHKTVVTVNLNSYPRAEGWLRLFLPSYLFLPKIKGKGFVIYTKDYLELVTEVDSRLNESRTQEMGGAVTAPKKSSATQDEMAYEGFFDLDGN